MNKEITRTEAEALVQKLELEIREEAMFLMKHSSLQMLNDNNILGLGHHNDHPFATINLTTSEIKEYNW